MIWWKDATIYQVWPASYKDSNGDGIGDINGLISTLDYLKELGVDVIWLSPMYDSPQDDMGYDISDYQKIYPKYGDMKDMDNLISGCHERGMKLILDLVINHTSSEHQWFKESSSSKTNPKRDWYIWKPPKYDADGNRQPPNNWRSYFSGSAWEYHQATDEYYLRLFAASQPDLNWENEECRKTIYENAMEFWYKKGIDGFRIDTAALYSKDQRFPNAPVVFPDSKWQVSDIYTKNGPRIHEFHKEMNRITSQYNAMTVGEVGDCSREDALKYVSAKEHEMDMLFLFDLVSVGTKRGDRFRMQPFNLTDIKTAIDTQCGFIKGTDAWATVFIENHDQPRSITRFGGTKTPELAAKSAKLIALFQATLTGTLFIYQGQEIGMTNFPRSWGIEEYQDIRTLTTYKNIMEENGIDKDDPQMVEFMDNASIIARDHARTPVQWDDSAYAGFSTVKPWMRVNDNYKQVNVAKQKTDPDSVLSYYKKVLKLRKENKQLFIHGDFEILDFDNLQTFTYVKRWENETAYVVLNFSDEPAQFVQLVQGEYEVLESTGGQGDVLQPFEGRVYKVKESGR